MVFTKDKASFPGLCLPEERTVGEVRFDPGLALGLYCLDESGCGGRGHVDATESENIDYKNRQSWMANKLSINLELKKSRVQVVEVD